MVKTFDELDREAAALSYGAHGTDEDMLRERVNHIIAHADDNGTDEETKLASVSFLCAHEEFAPARDWFAARGVRY